MFHFIYLWIDILWLPIAFFTVHKKHRWWAAGLIISCMIMMRLQIEIMEQIGHPNGILPIIESHVNLRALFVYSFFYILFIAMAHYSPKTDGIIFMGACLTIFFMVFVVSSFIMLL